MTELEALRRVAEAAQILAHSCGVIRGKTPEDDDTYTVELDHIRDLNAAIADLDALPTEAPGVMVDIANVCEQAINDKLAAVPNPRSYEMAHYCLGLEDAILAIRSKIVRLPRIPEIVAAVEDGHERA